MECERPYFTTNTEWYYYDEDKGILRLTDKAPPEAVKSYEEFYDMQQKVYDDVIIT